MKILTISLIFIIIAGLLGYKMVTGQPSDTSNIVGYISDWSLERVSLSNIKLKQLTHLIYTDIQVTSAADPTLKTSNGWDYLDQCVKAGHTNGVKVLASLYGPPGGELDAVVNSDILRPALINNILAMVREYDLDGIDIDWESDEPQSDMDRMIIDLHGILHPMNKIIAVAASAYHFDMSLTVSSLVDLIDVMTYDMSNNVHSYPYHSLYDDSVAAMQMWVNGGYAKDKLLMGVPFYGKDNRETVARYVDIVNDLNPDSGQNEANINSIQVWDGIVNPVRGGVVWWNGIDLAKQKAAWVKSENLGGIMCFEVGDDKLNDDRSLLQNIYFELFSIR